MMGQLLPYDGYGRCFMKSVVPKKAAALLLVGAAVLTFFVFKTVQTVRANAEAQLTEEWDGKAAQASSDAEEEPKKVICLTFDDGPSYLTPRVLEILKQYGVRATFFVTGINPQYAYCIKEARDAGHTIGMHTYSHDYGEVYASAEAYYADLDKISRLCVEQIGYIPRYIRFPGGSSNSTSVKYSPGLMTFLTRDVTQRGYLYYDWNCSSGDGEGNPEPGVLLENSKKNNGKNPVVLLCHDGGGKENTVEALPQIIEYYLSEGYQFQTIDEISAEVHHRVLN